MKRYSTVILGAGLCGLTCARLLKDKIAINDLLILEKSSSAGGRMATRRLTDGKFDHGAQFYKNSKAAPFLHHGFWQSIHKSHVWFSTDSVEYCVGSEGMNSLAKALIENINIDFNQKVVSLTDSTDGLIVATELNHQYLCKNLILTAPLPQSIELLKISNIDHPSTLNSIKYAKALVGLVRIEIDKASLPHISNFAKLDGDIFSVSSNHSKGISKYLDITVVMSDDFSEKHFDEPEVRINDLIVNKMKEYFSSLFLSSNQLSIINSQVKKWRFSHPLSQFADNYLCLNTKNSDSKIFLAGDAFGGPSLQGATRSAQSLIESVHFKL